VIREVYRGLAEPALYFFAKPNPCFDPSIQQTYLYNPERGKARLAEIGIHPGADGKKRDSEGN
ncbi:MAG: ABC transporter substrate-binding protein, partial [Spirochaetales bacterium]|nr:ABC transporter substrate-binding protein [Spirochaetales bacterium]